MAVITVKVVAEAPLWGQGDTEASPKPEPRATKMRVVAAAAMAPAKMAGHEVPETGDSNGRSAAAVGRLVLG